MNNLLSLAEVDDSSGICVALAREEDRQIAANALANRFTRAPAARSITA